MENDRLKKIQFKRLLTKYESALEDLEYLKEMASEINSDFNSALAAKQRQDLFENDKVQELAEEEESEEKESPNRDPLFKKLFRKIVIKCHPDRMDPDLSIKQQAEYIDLYDQANKANDDDNMALLITVAIKLEIELSEEYYEHVHKIEEESQRIEKEIEGIQGSIAWQWYHAEDEKKDLMLDQYIKHMEKILLGPKVKEIKVLGLGHPRTGTGYTAALLNLWGLNVGHERLEKDGIIAWQLAINKGPWLYLNRVNFKLKPEITIYNVRDPRTSIPSIVYTENVKKESLEYRITKGKVIKSSNRVELAINSILQWDKLITSKKPDFVYRIEDQSNELFDFIKLAGYEVEYSELSEKVNSREHEGLDGLENELRAVRPSVKRKLNAFCEKYGYDSLF